MKLLNLFTVFAAVSAGPATADVELQMATDALEAVCEILYSNKILIIRTAKEMEMETPKERLSLPWTLSMHCGGKDVPCTDSVDKSYFAFVKLLNCHNILRMAI